MVIVYALTMPFGINSVLSAKYISCYQRSFISEMEQAPFDRLFWNTNDCIAKLTIAIPSLWDRPCS